MRYATEGSRASLFASADVDVDPPAASRQRALSSALDADDRLIVSEPFADLPGVWQEIPQATAVTVRRGGVLEHRPFEPRPPGGRPVVRQYSARDA